VVPSGGKEAPLDDEEDDGEEKEDGPKMKKMKK
jgi:hypothetical protein